MEFEVNGAKWTIEEIDDERMKKEAENDYCLGLTVYRPQKIYILKDHINKIGVLKHELMHVWLYEHAHTQDDNYKYHFEEVCELVAKSNNFINDVIAKYISYKGV